MGYFASSGDGITWHQNYKINHSETESSLGWGINAGRVLETGTDTRDHLALLRIFITVVLKKLNNQFWYITTVFRAF
jgi:hypothetical protein